MENNNTSGGIGFFGLLGILFIALKLTGNVTWAWWIVLLPLYGPLIVLIAFLVITAIVITLVERLGRK